MAESVKKLAMSITKITAVPELVEKLVLLLYPKISKQPHEE